MGVIPSPVHLNYAAALMLEAGEVCTICTPTLSSPFACVITVMSPAPFLTLRCVVSTVLYAFFISHVSFVQPFAISLYC